MARNQLVSIEPLGIRPPVKRQSLTALLVVAGGSSFSCSTKDPIKDLIEEHASSLADKQFVDNGNVSDIGNEAYKFNVKLKETFKDRISKPLNDNDLKFLNERGFLFVHSKIVIVKEEKDDFFLYTMLYEFLRVSSTLDIQRMIRSEIIKEVDLHLNHEFSLSDKSVSTNVKMIKENVRILNAYATIMSNYHLTYLFNSSNSLIHRINTDAFLAASIHW